MIALAIAAALAGAPTMPGPTPAPAVRASSTTSQGAPVQTTPAAPTAHTPDPVIEPEWVNAPSQTMMVNCTTGYLTDPAFTGESIVMGCVVQPNGTLDACQVKETKRAQAAGVQDVAVCAAAGFRVGPTDKFGKPTVGRPIIIPMAIATVGDVINASASKATAAPAAQGPNPTVTTSAQSPGATQPKTPQQP